MRLWLAAGDPQSAQACPTDTCGKEMARAVSLAIAGDVTTAGDLIIAGSGPPSELASSSTILLQTGRALVAAGHADILDPLYSVTLSTNRDAGLAWLVFDLLRDDRETDARRVLQATHLGERIPLLDEIVKDVFDSNCDERFHTTDDVRYLQTLGSLPSYEWAWTSISLARTSLSRGASAEANHLMADAERIGRILKEREVRRRQPSGRRDVEYYVFPLIVATACVRAQAGDVEDALRLLIEKTSDTSHPSHLGDLFAVGSFFPGTVKDELCKQRAFASLARCEQAAMLLGTTCSRPSLMRLRWVLSGAGWEQVEATRGRRLPLDEAAGTHVRPSALTLLRTQATADLVPLLNDLLMTDHDPSATCILLGRHELISKCDHVLVRTGISSLDPRIALRCSNRILDANTTPTLAAARATLEVARGCDANLRYCAMRILWSHRDVVPPEEVNYSIDDVGEDNDNAMLGQLLLFDGTPHYFAPDDIGAWMDTSQNSSLVGDVAEFFASRAVESKSYDDIIKRILNGRSQFGALVCARQIQGLARFRNQIDDFADRVREAPQSEQLLFGMQALLRQLAHHSGINAESASNEAGKQ